MIEDPNARRLGDLFNAILARNTERHSGHAG
jgi:hypothetical protein